MAAKHKRRVASPGGQVAVIERELQKGHVRQAFKDAKVAYRENPNEELRVLYARVSVARAKELLQQGLSPQAKDVVQEILALGEADPALRPELASILAALGMAREQARIIESLDDPEARAQALLAAADTAVLHPAGDAALPPEARADAAAIRRAIELFEQSRDEEGLAAVRDLPRQSPLADWKLFLRGFAAWRRGEAAEAEANWRRLAPGRLPARAAAQLSPSAGESKSAAAELSAAQDSLSAGPHRQAVVELSRLKKALTEDSLERAFTIAGKAREAWRRLDPKLPARIEAMLCDSGIRSADPGVLNAMARHLARPRLDPRFNRAMALASELDRHAPANVPDSYWIEYLADLATLPALADKERLLARALVFIHRAEYLSRHADSPEVWDFHSDGRGGKLHPIRKKCLECLEQARRLAPDLIEPYELEWKVNQEWDYPRAAAEAATRLLDRFPEHLGALVFLIDHYQTDEPLRAREYARRAHRLKPLDTEVAAKAVGAHLGALRHYIREGDFERGRQEFSEVERFSGGKLDPVALSRRGILEVKAGQSEEAKPWFDRAAEAWGDPLPMILECSIEARRCRLSPCECDRFASDWRQAVGSKGVTCLGIGLVCEILAAFLHDKVSYPGLGQDVKEIVALYNKHARKRFSVRDLRRVAELLRLVPRESESYHRLVARAATRFPADPYFAIKAIESELTDTSHRFNQRKALARLAKVKKAAENSHDPEEREWIEEIDRGMELVRQAFSGGMAGFGMPGFGLDPDSIEELMRRMRGGLDQETFEEVFEDLDD